MYDPHAIHIIVAGTAPRKGQPPLTPEEIGAIWAGLDWIKARAYLNGSPLESVTTGIAQGVDYEAKRWAHDSGIWTNDFPANWQEHNRAAGPIRNKLMVRETIARYGRENVRWYGFTRGPLEQSLGTRSCYEIASQTHGLPTNLFRLDLNEWEF